MTKPQDPEVVNQRKGPLVVAAGLALFTFALMATTNFDGAFLFDDRPNLLENPAIKGFRPGSLASWLQAAFHSPARLRPLPYLSFAWEWHLSGGSPLVFHLVSDLLHGLAAAALFWASLEFLASLKEKKLIKDLTDREQPWLAGAGALLWAVHPVQTQAVTYVVQRMSVMAGLFGFLALGFYFRARRIGGCRNWALAGTSYLLALLSKESAAVLPVLLFLYEYLLRTDTPRAERRKIFRGLLVACLPPLIMAVLYARMSPLHFGVGTLPGRDYSFFDRIVSAPRAYWRYLLLLIVPYPQALDYGLSPSQNLLSPWTTLPCLLLGTVVLWRVLKEREAHGMLAFSLLAFVVAILPESTFLNVEFFYEHRLYVSSAFLLVPLPAAGLLWLRKNKPELEKTGKVALSVVVIVLCALTALRNRDWSSALGLLEQNVAARPMNGRVHYNLAQELVRQGDTPRAITEYEKAEELGYGEAAFALATTLHRIGETDRAREIYERAIKEHPRPGDVWTNLGVLKKQQGDLAGAADAYRKALEVDPMNASAWLNLGSLMLAAKNYAEARKALDKAIELDPEEPNGYVNRMILFIRQGNLYGGSYDWEKAQELGAPNLDQYEGIFYPIIVNRKRREAQFQQMQTGPTPP